MPDFSAQARAEAVCVMAFRTAAELARIYESLAQAASPEKDGVRAIFAMLAQEQAEAMRALDACCGASPGAPDAPGPLPLVSAEEVEALAQSELITPYRALSAAVAHCERAFVAWAYVSAGLEDARARAVAEDFARAALRRADALRRERRRAWRDETEEKGRRKPLRASEKERRLLAELRGLAAQSSGARREALLALLPRGLGRGEAAPASGSAPRARRYAEELTNMYIDAIAKAETAAGVARARRRAMLSVLRLGRMRALLDTQEPDGS